MWLRVWALFLRYIYLHKRSVTRTMEIFFWPVMNLVLWGFVTKYLGRLAGPGTVTYLLGGVVLWDLLYRSQHAVSLSLTEEFWERNIVNLFAAPIRPVELVLAACGVGFVRALVMTVSSAVIVFLAFDFNILGMGPSLGWFYLALMVFGWSVGLFTMGLVFLFGRAADGLIWGVPFLIQPLSAVFYPVDVLPGWLQAVALCLPSTYVFEGMRAALAHGSAPLDLLVKAAVGNAIFLALGGIFFAWTLERVRVRGALARQAME